MEKLAELSEKDERLEVILKHYEQALNRLEQEIQKQETERASKEKKDKKV
jgi:hypothetical protein